MVFCGIGLIGEFGRDLRGENPRTNAQRIAVLEERVEFLEWRIAGNLSPAEEQAARTIDELWADWSHRKNEERMK